MSTVIRLLPGIIGALVGFVALQVMKIFTFTSVYLELLAFLVSYLVVAVALDRALRDYGGRKR